MAHQLRLKKETYRQWVKATLGFGYLKEGLAPFCDDIAKQQHKDILDNIKEENNMSAVACGQCTLKTLKPDHVKMKNKQCPLGLPNCNCCHQTGKTCCPNNVCGVIYDHIITYHASKPPAPNWKNTQTQQWTGDPWSIAKCFINAPGYQQKSSVSDIDGTGLLHVIINNKYFHSHIAGTNIFSKVRQHRNEIFHSSAMELERSDADTYIDDMIAALQCGEELRSRQDAIDAVKKLQELKNEEFIITTEYMEDVCLDIREETGNIRKQMEGLTTQEDIEGLKSILSAMESLISHLTEEIKELKTNHSPQQEQSDYEKSKSDFQKNLIELYRGTFLKVSAIPMQPDQKHCNIGRVYIRPRMTYEKQDEDGQREETEIQSMSDIFTKAGHFKSIYVLGDAGSGKSSFCKGLVNDWCLAHSHDQKTEDKDTFAGIEEMKKFDFLFYISLRHSKDDVGIFQMLERQYKKKDLLKQLLQDKSVKSLIVLDGLDEWSPPAKTSNQFQTEGLPERDLYKDYVIITTSRPWKVETLGLTDADVEQRLDLKGFDTSSVETMIKKTVAVLNETFKKNKDSRDCKNKIINNNQIADIVHIPIMLQQLICLWFDDKLPESSRCSVYTGMLDLLFKWNVKKYPDDSLFEGMRKKSNDLSDVELPLCFSKSEKCKSYKYIIHRVSKLAYETLFNNPKETSLTFDNSIFEHLEIETEIKTCCLKLGILSEDTCPSFSASTSQSSIFSFIHKSVQEFLAAVYIAIKSGDHIGSSVDEENANISNRCAFLRNCFCPSSTREDVYEMDLFSTCKQFVNEIFSKCASLDKILEQANVFIMLCGLEPRIALSISKKIYEIVKMDERVLEYKKQ